MDLTNLGFLPTSPASGSLAHLSPSSRGESCLEALRRSLPAQERGAGGGGSDRRPTLESGGMIGQMILPEPRFP